MIKEDLLNKINKRKARICVIGLGQVGLPTALTFCKVGFDVTGYDINAKLISDLKIRRSPFEEKDLEELLQFSIDNNRFHPTTDFSLALNDSDVVIVCVSTPLTNEIRPDLSSLKDVCTSLSHNSLSGKLIIIESSIPPTTFEGMILPLLREKNNIGLDSWAVFIPERLTPGHAFLEIETTSRIVGSVDEDSGLLAKSLYQNIVKSEIITTDITVAEISKLVENTYRDVNIAFANEVSLICETYGIDVKELLKVCNSHPRVNVLQPGPGVGGPCLPKDSYLLLNPKKGIEIKSKIISESRRINDSMPLHVVDLVKSALKEEKKDVKGSTIIVLGVAYKANVSDVRYSPAEPIISQLIKSGCDVLVYDPKSKESFEIYGEIRCNNSCDGS